jgi:N12 class adenine-specific DNA methylase
MAKKLADQSSFDDLFDTSALSSGFLMDNDFTGLSVLDDDEEAGAAAPVGKTAEVAPRTNWRMPAGRSLAPTWRLRAADNLAAIELLHALETEGRHATPQEQDVLGQFTAFASTDLCTTMFRRRDEDFRPEWAGLGQRLEALATAEEMAGLKRALQYAHYTPPFIIDAMWAMVTRMGFVGGNVIEPGCGTGLFLSRLPGHAAPNTLLTGIETDSISARIATELFPDAWIRKEDFCKARLPETYDLAIGNVPFSDRTVRAPDPAGALGLTLHDYFIARSIERLKPGGIAAFISSHGTLDKQSATARRHIDEMADLVGAVRLPQGALRAYAGTDVVVDVLVFQKRGEGTASNGVEWTDLAVAIPATDEDRALEANAYFVRNPEMVLGDHQWTSSAYGPTYGCKRRPGLDIEAALGAALETLAIGTCMPTPDLPKAGTARPVRVAVGTAAEGANVKEGSYLVIKGELHQVLDGQPLPVPVKSPTRKEGIPASDATVIRALIPIRDNVRAVIRAQEANESWGQSQIKLKVAYNTFLRVFGPINKTKITERKDEETGEVHETVRRPNLRPFLDDPDVWLVSSIETYDPQTEVATRGPIFSQRVIHPPAEPLITSAADALAVTLGDVGHVDMARIAELLGRSQEETLAELGNTVFRNPELAGDVTPGYETSDAYLSGQVRTKLAVAQASAVLDRSYQRNVDALLEVQPVDLMPSEITVKLGAPWVPAEDVQRFCKECIGIETRVRHTVAVASWFVDMHPFLGDAKATSEWGTARRHAGELLTDALNSSIPQIFDVWRDSQGEHRELNATETEAAKEKLAKIKTSFTEWVWTDATRAMRLARIYNDTFNNLVPRSFDGSHLVLPGASSAITLRPHQKRVIWRMICGGVYMAHAVGAGKTYAMAAGIMEQRRLGLIPMGILTVPGHCLAQASREFLQLYPKASIMVADETNFTKDKRQRFLARATTGVWDAIIITHSAFKKIPAPAWFEREMIEEQIASYEAVMEKVESDDRITLKRLENLKEKLEERLTALSADKDDLVTIAEMGVGQIIVDEAQVFRKLSFGTNMGTLKGIAPEGSQAAWDLFVKARYLRTKHGSRSLVMASGTPVSNTMGELWTLSRYMDPDTLEDRGLHEFDAWASAFGETQTDLELQPSGAYAPMTRFATFVNVPELIAMFRMFADVVTAENLNTLVDLPGVATGRRQVITAPASPAFRDYQRHLASRIHEIQERKSRPQKGDDILLSVITDGRHSSIDMRFVTMDDEAERHENEPGNKLNLMIARMHEIWLETKDRIYHKPDGTPFPIRGATQMMFSDLGTEAAADARGFSAYSWVRSELIRLGVPADQIAFMQDYKKSSAKQALFSDLNSGRKRFVLGSTQTMGTGVNAQTRLIAMHHLDVPWMPSDVEQREGRIKRQGNQNEEVSIYAYATLGSMDATSWQMLERKARFIDLALSGDRTVRKLEDVESTVNQFAMAKAIASGDARLMQKAGLDARVDQLRRQKAAHFDDQIAVRWRITGVQGTMQDAKERIANIRADIARHVDTRGDAFEMRVGEHVFSERKNAGEALLTQLRHAEKFRKQGEWTAGSVAGFDLRAVGHKVSKQYFLSLYLERAEPRELDVALDLKPLGLISRIEHAMEKFEVELREQVARHDDAERTLPGYQARLGTAFEHAEELALKEAELGALQEDLAKTVASKDEEAVREAA